MSEPVACYLPRCASLLAQYITASKQVNEAMLHADRCANALLDSRYMHQSANTARRCWREARCKLDNLRRKLHRITKECADLGIILP